MLFYVGIGVGSLLSVVGTSISCLLWYRRKARRRNLRESRLHLFKGSSFFGASNYASQSPAPRQINSSFNLFSPHGDVATGHAGQMQVKIGAPTPTGGPMTSSEIANPAVWKEQNGRPLTSTNDALSSTSMFIPSSTQNYGTVSTLSGSITGGSTTMQASSMLSIPGYLLLDLERDFRLGETLAKGGTALVRAAESLNDSVIQRNGGGTSVAIKFYNDDPARKESDLNDLFRVSRRVNHTNNNSHASLRSRSWPSFASIPT